MTLRVTLAMSMIALPLATLAAGPAAGRTTGQSVEPPPLSLPVDCVMGRVCHIQNYVDQDPGPGRRDYACGRLSYDGHRGTDFRLPDYPTMRAGVDVVAAAPGRVLRVRDGVADVSIEITGGEAVKGREAGNGVVIDHGDGWHTQYSHLKRGTVAVRPGDAVATGDRLGQIGLSGKTEFPHLHFSVRHQGRDVDPFVGTGGFQGCEAPRAPLWSADTLAQLPYVATGLLVDGFAPSRPDKEAARQGTYGGMDLGSDPAALVYWVDLFGAMTGDRQRFRLTGPDGTALLDRTTTLEASNVSWFAFAGIRRPADGWRPGPYTARYTLERDGRVVVRAERETLASPAGR